MKITITFNKIEKRYECKASDEGDNYIIKGRELQKIIYNAIRRDDFENGRIDDELYMKPQIMWMNDLEKNK